MHKWKSCPQVFAATSASLILVATGFHMAWPTPSLVQLFADDSEITLTTGQGSWIASMSLVGSVFGSLAGFFLIDSWGRKNTLLLMAGPLFVSCVLIALAKSYRWLYLARFDLPPVLATAA
ncbi:facilitated trehalose transporter Tret1-2 homolog [Athalia rosae]|uniref:facilitated trehalose transporter Tret1-2 homolog n=1 Tax=Athalia rosae TaxID=37344 RepID=UPI002033B889|nr:facilitated trehalose transporter Tret1-2 homolog [Athalia rosae]